jgi:NAD(P)-dependent dehydrogenase (short-subunit alcohol dehydrogenase family)
MLIDLTGKTALVTGSTSGIGFGTAAGLHAAGATVVVNGRTADRVEDSVARLGGGERLIGVAADIGTAEGCEALVAEVPDVDILVNNAGIAPPQEALEIPDSEWDRLWAVNVMSGIRLSRAYMPGMIERDWGRVLFVSSESALAIPPEMIHYGTTKLAQLGVARGLAESVRGNAVTVNSVLPGPTMTPGLEAFMDQGIADREEAGRILVQQMRPSSLLGRPARVEEVANLIVYLSSEQASATTGTSMRVDAGVVRTIA